MATFRCGQPRIDDAVRSDRADLSAPSPWLACLAPDCNATAEVIDRYTLTSSDGPVSMVRARCLGQHIRDWIDD
jgi:hypothetical protein